MQSKTQPGKSMKKYLRMLLILPALATFSAAMFSKATQANSYATYSCGAVDKEAVAGAYLADIVVVTEISDQKRCRFSINGAPSGSPPLDLLADAWRSMLRGQGGVLFSELSRSNELLPRLAIIMSPAWPGETIPDGLTYALSVAWGGTGLGRCFEAFVNDSRDYSSSDSIRPFLESGNAQCQIVEPPWGGTVHGILKVPGDFGHSNDGIGVAYNVAVRQIQIAVSFRDSEVGEVQSYLFYPDQDEAIKLEDIWRRR